MSLEFCTSHYRLNPITDCSSFLALFFCQSDPTSKPNRKPLDAPGDTQMMISRVIHRLKLVPSCEYSISKNSREPTFYFPFPILFFLLKSLNILLFLILLYLFFDNIVVLKGPAPSLSTKHTHTKNLLKRV